jgi:sugar O-acyltransferase (sialic acid O-acetyltransferase NeuD family)
MIEVFVPKENVNDEEVIIVKLFFKPGSKVTEGDIIFEIETTKVNVDIEAPVSGIIHHSVSVGDTIGVGSVLCTINDENDSQFKEKKVIELVDERKNNRLKISKAAIKKANELNVDLSNITEGMISVSDVERMSKDKDTNIFDCYEGGPQPKNAIVIIGAGGHAKTCIEIIQQNNEYEIIGIVDNKLSPGTEIHNIKVIGDNSVLKKLRNDGVFYAVNGVGSVNNPSVRKKIFHMLKDLGFKIPNLVHSSCVIEPSVKIGEGNQFFMGSTVGTDTVIGDNCIVNSGSIVSHDCILKNHCHISPGAILAGSVEIGDNSLIGMGATIYIGKIIGKDVVIYNGVNVLTNVEDGRILEK